jgi:hypothetical protein
MTRLVARPALLAFALAALVGCGSSESTYLTGLLAGGPLSAEQKVEYHYDTDISAPSAASYVESVDVPVQTEEGPLRKLVTYSRIYDIDRFYEAMIGPRSAVVVNLQNELDLPEPELLWIKGIHVEVVDEQGDQVSDEYTCHLVASVQSSKAHDEALGIISEDSRFTALAQGFYHKEYPKGFGLPILSSDQIAFSSMILNYNTKVGEEPLRLRHRIVTLYLRDRDLEVPMKALTHTYAQTMIQLDGKEGDGYFGVRAPDQETHGESCAMGVKALSEQRESVDFYGRRFTPHWIVPEGPSEVQTLVTKMMKIKSDTTINSIDPHLHPFGEWVELRDLTTNETVFRAEAEQIPDGVGLARVQPYSSSEGIPVYADHEYAVVAAYNNTRGMPTDGMAILNLGIHDKEFDAALLNDSAARRRLRTEREAAALERWSRAIEDDPDDPMAHYYAGRVLYQRGQLREAAEHFTTSVRLKPDNTPAAQALRRTLAQLGGQGAGG